MGKYCVMTLHLNPDLAYTDPGLWLRQCDPSQTPPLAIMAQAVSQANTPAPAFLSIERNHRDLILSVDLWTLNC